MKTITIKTLTELNELVAEELGWPYYKNEFEYCGMPASTEGWVPPTLYSGDEEDWLENQEWWVNDGNFAPPFFDDYKWMEIILLELDNLNLHTELIRTKDCSIVLLSASSQDLTYPNYMDTIVEVLLGNHKNARKDLDLHTLPLAVCIAFLQFKDINLTFELEN